MVVMNGDIGLGDRSFTKSIYWEVIVEIVELLQQKRGHRASTLSNLTCSYLSESAQFIAGGTAGASSMRTTLQMSLGQGVIPFFSED
jgi:hypothetical protein